MAEESDIRITQWPKEPLGLSHRFDSGDELPVKLAFGQPVEVSVGTGAGPLDVAMQMDVSARRPIPLCFTLCEPICARSDYRIDIAIFDQPVANIVVRGLTRLFNCGDEPPQEPPKEICTNAERVPPDTEYPNGVALPHGVRAFPLGGGALRVVTFGDPPGRQKLGFPAAGIRIDLPGAANQVRLTLNSYAGMSLDIAVLGAGGAVIETRSEPFRNEVRTLVFNRQGITAIEVRGGQNEAAFVEVCHVPAG